MALFVRLIGALVLGLALGIGVSQAFISSQLDRLDEQADQLLAEQELLRLKRFQRQALDLWYGKAASSQTEFLRLWGQSIDYDVSLVERRALPLAAPQQQALTEQGALQLPDSEKDGRRFVLLMPNASLVAVYRDLEQMPDAIRSFEMVADVQTDQAFIIASLLLFGVLLASVLICFHGPARYCRHLYQVCTRLAAGDLTARADEQASASLARFGKTLNRMTQRLSQMQEDQTFICNAIPHELRAPLARLRFATDLLSPESQLAELVRYSDRMRLDIDLLEQMLERLLTYNSLQQDCAPASFSDIELASLVDTAVSEARFRADRLNIGVVSGDSIVTACQPRWILAALRNLLSNAERFAQSDIRITALLENQQVILQVEDDGPGIPDALRLELIRPFSRFNDENGAGYGLGLAIIQRVMHQHGGSLVIDDSPLGGARITLSWPQAPGINAGVSSTATAATV